VPAGKAVSNLSNEIEREQIKNGNEAIPRDCLDKRDVENNCLHV
jgi:hypothetical protein